MSISKRECYIGRPPGGIPPAPQTLMMEAILLRPFPPFRAKPSRKPIAPKPSGEGRKETAAIAVKAQRHPIKLARLNAAPPLKILGRDAHA